MVVSLFFLHGLLESLLSKDGTSGEMYQGFCTEGIAPPCGCILGFVALGLKGVYLTLRRLNGKPS